MLRSGIRKHGGCRLGGLVDLRAGERLREDARRHVGEQRHAHDLHAAVGGDDGLGHGGHTDRVGAEHARGADLGKTEMWYVLSAEPDAFLYCGFSRDISRDELKRRIADNTLPEVLRRVNVKAGDTVFIPAGTIHAICRGIVVAEVQQSSNVTYRVCDYGRLGPDGKPRALHIAQALDVTRRTAGVPTPDFGGHLARCDYFTVDLLAAPQAAPCGAESFLSLLILDGEGEVRCGGEAVRAKKGESLFLPAGSGEARLTGTLRALATRI